MFPTYRDLMIRQEQIKDRLREAEQRRRFGLDEGSPAPVITHRRVAGWLGRQLVRWGAALQRYGTVSPVMSGETRLTDAG